MAKHLRQGGCFAVVYAMFIMDKKKSKKDKFLDACVPAISYLPAKIVPYLPLSLVRLIGHCLFLALYPVALVTDLKKRFAINIAVLFEKNPRDSDVQKIARKTIHNWIMNITEIFYFYHPKNRDTLIKHVRVDGLEKINRLKNNTRGVIGVSPHFGNFPLMIFRFNIEDINMSYLFKEVEQGSIARAMREYIHNLDLNVILTNNQSNPTNKAIKKINDSGFVIFIADEFKKTTGVKVNFFQKPTLQAVGPSLISLKTSAPILPVFIIREKQNLHRIVIEDPIHCELTGDKEVDIQRLTQKRLDIFERYIRKYPDLWLWVHSRWLDKTEPPVTREGFRENKQHIN